MDMFEKKEFNDIITRASDRSGNGPVYFQRNDAIMLNAALLAFMKKPTQFQKKIMAEGVSTDLPIITKESFNTTLEIDNVDNFWELAYQKVPLGEKQDSWEIATLTNSLIHRKVEEGQRIQVDEITGSLIDAKVEYYGGALGWTDKMIRFRKLARMADAARIFRNKYFVTKGNVHYALLAAAAAIPANITAYQGVAGNGQLQRDIQTINQAAYNLANRNKDKGYGDTANSPQILYANPLLKNRINAAFAVTSNALAGAGQTGDTIGYNIRIVYTFNSFVETRPILVLPGRKIQRASALEATVFNAPQDILTLNITQAVWAIYGAIIGDTDQCEGITFG